MAALSRPMRRLAPPVRSNPATAIPSHSADSCPGTKTAMTARAGKSPASSSSCLGRRPIRTLVPCLSGQRRRRTRQLSMMAGVLLLLAAASVFSLAVRPGFAAAAGREELSAVGKGHTPADGNPPDQQSPPDQHGGLVLRTSSSVEKPSQNHFQVGEVDGSSHPQDASVGESWSKTSRPPGQTREDANGNESREAESAASSPRRAVPGSRHPPITPGLRLPSPRLGPPRRPRACYLARGWTNRWLPQEVRGTVRPSRRRAVSAFPSRSERRSRPSSWLKPSSTAAIPRCLGRRSGAGTTPLDSNNVQDRHELRPGVIATGQ